MTVASDAESNAGHEPIADAPPPPPASVPSDAAGGVTITVTGHMAADMIGRGETEKRARVALAAELRLRLDALEAALVHKAAEQERLERQVQELRGQLVQLGGQSSDHVTQLRTELGRMRSGLVEAGDRFRDVHGRLDRLEGSVEGMHGTVGDVHGTVAELQNRVARMEGTVGTLGETVGRLASPPERQRPLLLSWRKGLHFWTMVAAVALTATAGALWLYA
jgi:archaellum component FlaC